MKANINLRKCGMYACMFTLCSYTPNPWDSKQKSSVENQADNTQLNFTVHEAPEWTSLFKRSSGWFGADGIFAIPLDGRENVQATFQGKTMLIFSDTMIGQIKNGRLDSGFHMVNNTVAYLTGNEAQPDRIHFEWAKDVNNKPISLFKPKTNRSEESDYYWLGDGFVNTERANTTYIFAYRMRNFDPKDDWSFRKMGTTLIALPKGSEPPFKDCRQIETPLDYSEGGFGAGIFVNTKEAGVPEPDGYIYVYGVKGKEKNLVVARVLPKNFENFEKWRFWDGKGWNIDKNQVVPIAGNVSNELSVSALPNGKYALIYQHNSISPQIVMRIGATPYSTFGSIKTIWNCKEAHQKNIYTYNAKAHPSLSAPGELLISYNVNAFDFMNEIKKDPQLYRPRFLKIVFQK